MKEFGMVFLNTINHAKIGKKQLISQRQALIKLIQKKYKDKRHIKQLKTS